MSVTKLMSRVVASEEDTAEGNFKKGIASDALLLFSMIFASLCHDVDHSGVPNTQLAAEKPELAKKYNHMSIAENNSIEVAWTLFMQPRFEAFRKCLAPTDKDLERFHTFVVEAILATDIVEKDLKADRNKRWEDAFSGEKSGNEAEELKVRIVFEHLIQASGTCGHCH